MTERFDLAVLVPLHEEFEYLTELLPVRDTRRHDDEYYFVLDGDQWGLRLVAVVLEEMGEVQAALSAERLVNSLSVSQVVVTGIAGSLDTGLRLGDIVIGSEIVHYLQASRATETDSGFALEAAGTTIRAPYGLLQFARNSVECRRLTIHMRIGEQLLILGVRTFRGGCTE